MEQPWTLEILSYYLSFLNYSVVQAVQQGWTIHQTHEMFYYVLCSFNYSVVCTVDWIELPRTHETHSLRILISSNSQLFKQFGWMEPSWTHEVLSYDPSSLNFPLVQGVQQGWTTPKYWNILLWSLFPRLLVSSAVWLVSNNLNT